MTETNIKCSFANVYSLRYIYFSLRTKQTGLGGNTSDFIQEVPRLNLGARIIRDEFFVFFLAGPADMSTR
jgi:hypothetical protein